ncbi:hypothetical protein [Sphingobacterium humi]|uniref:Uncharacterized protein n=1 Tax=Sphingobacterium humi TaxID=1796905 RepID=A0A6N8KYH3_9SPHI|nr:hypothetical protein [Sphingobacterium humi]MVZ62147.1 hypothetical protein [Sphingobacterium humi]
MSKIKPVKPESLQSKRGLEPSPEELQGIERELAWTAEIIGRKTDVGMEYFDDQDEDNQQ